MSWQRWVLLAAGVLFVLVLGAWLAGRALPREHRAACRATFRAAPETLFALIADVEASPSWRPEVKSVRRIEPIGGKPAHVEETGSGSTTFALEESTPPRRLVLRIADESLPYGGTWTFALEPDGERTTLTITENGFVGPALFRLLSKYVFGHHATMESYLEAVGAKLGQAAVVERVV